MKILPYILIINACFLLFNCSGQNNKSERLTNEEMVEKFKQQKHRFEFRDTLLFYNDQNVLLDQPLSYYEKIFGKKYKRTDRGRVIEYENLPISLNKGMDSIVDNIYIYMYYKDESVLVEKEIGEGYGYPLSITDEDYILIDGVAINKNTDDLEWFNEELRKKGKEEFTRGIAGSSSVHRWDISGMDYGYGIFIHMGKLSPLSAVAYFDDRTRSK